VRLLAIASVSTGFLITLGLPGVARTEPLRVESVLANNGTYLVVTLTNRAKSEKVLTESLEIGPDARDAIVAKLHRELIPGETLIERKALKSKSDQYLIVAYRFGGRRHIILRSLPRAPAREAGHWSDLIVPAAFSLGGVIIGAGLSAYWTAKRESARTNFDWSRMLYERYEASFREFMSVWQGSQSAGVLKTQFERLREKTWLPRDLEDAYRTTYAILSSSAQEEKKSAAARSFRDALDLYMARPWTTRERLRARGDSNE
jgi:hypothetical protein